MNEKHPARNGEKGDAVERARWMTSYVDCVTIFLAILLYMKELRKRTYLAGRVIVSFVILLVVSVLLRPAFTDELGHLSSIWFLCVFLVDIGLCLLCCEISIWDGILTVSLGYALQNLAGSVYVLLVYHGKQPEWRNSTQLVVFVSCYAICYVLFIRGMSMDGTYGASMQRSLSSAAIIVSICMVLNLAVKFSIERVMEQSIGTAYQDLFRYCQIYAALISLFMIMMERIQQRELKYRVRSERNNTILQQRQQQYLASKDNIEAINRRCHDMKHQIAALAQEQGSGDEKKKYIAELQEMIRVYDTSIDTGNDALDTLLLERGLYCHANGIEWTCVADGTWLSFVDVVDLYTMLGNALDNAQEAVAKLDVDADKMIAVRIRKKSAFVVIQVENSCDAGLVIAGEKLPTTKKDKLAHGYGIGSIRSIAEKYHGTVSFRTEHGFFLLNILLPLAV